jgi:hypothetical protein
MEDIKKLKGEKKGELLSTALHAIANEIVAYAEAVSKAFLIVITAGYIWYIKGPEEKNNSRYRRKSGVFSESWNIFKTASNSSRGIK